VNLKGNSGPYLQYTYARALSVLKKAKEAGIDVMHLSQCESVEITMVERTLYQFPEVVERAAEEFAPHHVCTYLFSLAQEFNTYYGMHQIVAEDVRVSTYRVALTRAVAQVKEWDKLLGFLRLNRCNIFLSIEMSFKTNNNCPCWSV
jgi:arginyl-tRNA synthetase